MSGGETGKSRFGRREAGFGGPRVVGETGEKFRDGGAGGVRRRGGKGFFQFEVRVEFWIRRRACCWMRVTPLMSPLRRRAMAACSFRGLGLGPGQGERPPRRKAGWLVRESPFRNRRRASRNAASPLRFGDVGGFPERCRAWRTPGRRLPHPDTSGPADRARAGSSVCSGYSIRSRYNRRRASARASGVPIWCRPMARV